MKGPHSLLRTIKRNVVRAGFTGEIYRAVQPLILEENARIMQRLSGIGMLFGSVMTVLSLAGAVSRRVLPAYLTLLVVSVLSHVLQISCSKRNKTPGLAACYLQMGAILAYGVMNSSFFSPSSTTMGVTVIVLITLVPFLLTDVPWRECLLILSAGCAYLLGVHLCKDPSIRGIETTNTVSFCLIACLSAVVFTSRTIRALADRLYIEKERDTDSLTGLSSRHAGEVLTRSQLLRGVHGVFIMMDVDDFKSANDNYGHLFGDHVLQAVGASVSACVRRKDIASRYGGDEFCILLVDCEMQDAHDVAARIQHFLAESMKGFPMQITCSFGLTQVQPQDNLETLITRADRALYTAKRSGKNQIAEDPESRHLDD